MDLGDGLISTVLQDGEMGLAVECGVTTAFFTDQVQGQVWNHMVRHWQVYGTSPTADVVLKSFPSYELGTYPHPVSYYINALAERRREQIVINAAQEVVDALNAEGGDRGVNAVKVMQQAIMQAAFETSPTRQVSYVDQLARRIPEWMNGIETPSYLYGFPTLDASTGGLRPEQFVMLQGLAKARKSFTALHLASNLNAYGAPVIFITFEMSNDEQLERLATLWGHLDYNLVTRDKSGITKKHYTTMQRHLRVRKALPPLMGVEDAYGHSTVKLLQALVQDTDAKVLVIDGVYFLIDEVTGQQGSEDNKALANISRALKRLAKSAHISVIGTTQTLYSKTKGGKANLFSMGYTSAFSQDADLVVVVEKPEEHQDTALMRIVGNRSGPQGVEFYVHWDLIAGVVEEVAVDEGVEDYDDIS